MDNQNSSLNTVLIVLVIIILAFGAAWFFGSDRQPLEQDEDEGLNVDVTIPSNENEGDIDQ